MKTEMFDKVREFVDEHKKPILTVGSIIATCVLAIIGYHVLEQNNSEPYSSQWLEGLSDGELREEHEKARLALRDSGDDWDLACKMDFLRRQIDSEIEKRKNDGTDNYVYPPHREHGRNLYKPD